MIRSVTLPSIPDDFPVKRIPAGVRAIPLPERPTMQPRHHAETCGSGGKLGRIPRLDELDGDAFK